MGQAFDRDGNVLGEAYGETKREVFDKLSAEFNDAHEIRIKSQLEEMSVKVQEIDQRQEDAFIAQDRMLQFFVFRHLPPHLQDISRPFRDLAASIVNKLPSNPVRTVALRKLLEAKDCAVRALIYKG
jgi:hypothetical protein